MKTLLLYLLQVIIASGILYAYYHLVLRNKRFHQYNRFYLLAAAVISVLIPFLNIPVYFAESAIQSSVVLQTLQNISPSDPETETATTAVLPGVAAPFNWNGVAYIIYALVVAVVMVRILTSLRKIRAIIKNNTVEELEGIRFVNTIEPGTPYSFFRWLFWNKKIELRSEKGEQIFRHEIYHIQQKHSLDILLMELLTAFFWINPFFHLIKKEMKAIHEFLADRFAVHKSDKWEYAELLLMQALNTQQQLVNPFFHNQIKRRIAMITNPQKTSHRYLRKLLVLPVAAIVLLLFAFSYKKSNSAAFTRPDEPITIVVDAGHGGSDAGAKSPDQQYTEAQIALQIAKQIKKLANEYNINVVMTREDGNFPGNAATKDAALKKRVEISEVTKPAAFISVHVNAETGHSGDKSGFDAYISARRNDPDAKMLAEAILLGLSSVYPTNNKPVQRQEAGMYVLDKNNYPSVYLQCGYITNAKDLAFIIKPENQEKLARSILEAIVSYKKSQTKLNGSGQTEEKAAITPKNDPDEINGTLKIVRTDSANSKKSSKIIINGKEFNIKELKIDGLEDAKIEAAELHIPKGFMGGRDTANSPLIVIDGVRVSHSALKNIDPASIESLYIYKGPAAQAKYGNEAINGVIEIFTRQNSNTEIKEITSGKKPFDPDVRNE